MSIFSRNRSQREPRELRYLDNRLRADIGLGPIDRSRFGYGATIGTILSHPSAHR